MKDTGHIAMAERPETFNDLMMEFLASESGARRARPPTASRRSPRLSP